MTNAELIQKASAGVSELARLYGQYAAAKIMLANGEENRHTRRENHGAENALCYRAKSGQSRARRRDRLTVIDK